MTETEWLASVEVDRLLMFAARYTSRRKEQLFAVACCRRVARLLSDHLLGLLAQIERSADERLTVAELRELSGEAMATTDDLSWHMGTLEGYARWMAADAVWEASERYPAPAALSAAQAVEVSQQDPATFRVGSEGPPSPGDAAERAAQIGLFRCIVGNPFQAARLGPVQIPSLTTGLARAAYGNRILPSGHLDPARLAVLSDALEEAGCTDANILTHLRSSGPHVRGCWALDLVLAKS